MPSRLSRSRATPPRYATSKRRAPPRPWTTGGCSPSPRSSTSRKPPSSSATSLGQPALPLGSTSDGSLPSPRLTSAGTRRWPLRTSSSRLFFQRMAWWRFMTNSGILTAKKVPAPPGSTGKLGLFIELDFPMIGFLDCNEMPSIPETLNSAPIVSVHKSAIDGDLIVELSSAKEVVAILPNIDEIKTLACRGLIVTGPAPTGSGYDFFTRFFCPKFGIDEDPVTGSIHCVLAPYWGRKLGKQKLTAFQASPRGGTLYLELDDANQRVQIQGEALTVMDGTLLA